MNYTDLKMYGLHSCDSCGAIVKDRYQDKHNTWHEVIENIERRLEDLLIAVIEETA